MLSRSSLVTTCSPEDGVSVCLLAALLRLVSAPADLLRSAIRPM